MLLFSEEGGFYFTSSHPEGRMGRVLREGEEKGKEGEKLSSRKGGTISFVSEKKTHPR